MNKSTEATTNNQAPGAFDSATFALFRAFCVSDESDECTLPIAFNGYRLSVAIEINDEIVRFGLGLNRGVNLFGGNKFEKEFKTLSRQSELVLTREEQFAKTFWFTTDKKTLMSLLQILQEMIYVSLHSNNQLNKFSLFPDDKKTREKLIALHVSLGAFVKKNRVNIDSLFNLTTQFIVEKLKTDPQFKHQVASKFSILPNDLKEKYNRHTLDQPLVLVPPPKIEPKVTTAQNQQPDKPCFCVLS